VAIAVPLVSNVVLHGTPASPVGDLRRLVQNLTEDVRIVSIST